MVKLDFLYCKCYWFKGYWSIKTRILESLASSLTSLIKSFIILKDNKFNILDCKVADYMKNFIYVILESWDEIPSLLKVNFQRLKNLRLHNHNMRQSIREWTKQVLWKTALENFRGHGLVKETIFHAFLKKKFTQNLLSQLLNTFFSSWLSETIFHPNC